MTQPVDNKVLMALAETLEDFFNKHNLNQVNRVSMLVEFLGVLMYHTAPPSHRSLLLQTVTRQIEVMWMVLDGNTANAQLFAKDIYEDTVAQLSELKRQAEEK